MRGLRAFGHLPSWNRDQNRPEIPSLDALVERPKLSALSLDELADRPELVLGLPPAGRAALLLRAGH